MQWKSKLFVSFFTVCFLIFFNCSSRSSSHILSPIKDIILSPTENIDELKVKCIEAALQGISLDRQTFLNGIENYDQAHVSDGTISIEEMRSRLAKLEEDLNKYKNIKLDSYQLPEKMILVAWIAYDEARENTQIHFEHQMRSGPFYHFTGINGDNYNIIETNSDLWEPKNKYVMTIHLVYPRYYPFPNYYIYIDSLKKVKD